MATYHLSIKSGKKGKAANHAAYIARQGKHQRDEDELDLLAQEHGNLPEWANNDPATFWKMADKHERANGAAYREFELALPQELSHADHRALLNAFIEQNIGDKPFQFAIHSPTAALGKTEQPHAHIMFSDRQPDGIERPAEQHFKRYNPTDPTAGGCKKTSGGKDPATLKSEVLSIRESWSGLQNAYLEQQGHAARVDHRSHKERGIENQPERHLGHVRIKMMSADEKSQFRAPQPAMQP